MDLVVAGTDNFEAQALINELAFRKRSRPCSSASTITRRAAGWSGPCLGLPPATAVWRGSGSKPLRTWTARSSTWTPLAARWLTASLSTWWRSRRPLRSSTASQDSAMGRFFERMGRRNDIVVRCDPEYAWGNALWDALLGDLPTQPKDFAKELREVALLAMDTIWLTGCRTGTARCAARWTRRWRCRHELSPGLRQRLPGGAANADD